MKLPVPRGQFRQWLRSGCDQLWIFLLGIAAIETSAQKDQEVSNVSANEYDPISSAG